MVCKIPVAGPWRTVADYGQIITADPEGVRDTIFANSNRGITIIEAKGGFTGTSRPMLYVVVGAHEVGRLKLRVAEVDPDAFVAISSAQEVFGEGFSPADAAAT